MRNNFIPTRSTAAVILALKLARSQWQDERKRPRTRGSTPSLIISAAWLMMPRPRSPISNNSRNGRRAQVRRYVVRGMAAARLMMAGPKD